MEVQARTLEEDSDGDAIAAAGAAACLRSVRSIRIMPSSSEVDSVR